jgi:hypothetical protein
VAVDEWQATSIAGVYAAGEITGIGGLDKALIEGKIAGLAAIGQHRRARVVFRQRRAAKMFADLLDRAFELRSELRRLPQSDTVVCRCEDVTFGQLQQYRSWRAAKLQTRCGMGPCQGRVCGAAVRFLFGWEDVFDSSQRPPVFPTSLGALAGIADEMSDRSMGGSQIIG